MPDQPQLSILLLGSHSAASIGVRSIIEASPTLALADTVYSHTHILAYMQRHAANAIVAVVGSITDNLLATLSEVHATGPRTSLVLFTTESDRERLLMAAQVPVSGLFNWTDASSESFALILHLTLHGTIVLGPSLAGTLLRARRQVAPERILTPLERKLIRGLENNMGQVQLSRMLDRDVRSVLRIRKRLEQKLGVAGSYKLGSIVQSMGLNQDIESPEVDD